MKNCPFCNCEISADHISDIHPITCYFVARQVLDDPNDIDRINVAWDVRPIEDALKAKLEQQIESWKFGYTQNEEFHAKRDEMFLARIAELEKDSVNDQRIIAVQNEDLRGCMERIAELEKNQQDWDQCEVQLAEAVTDSEKRIAELETELSEARRLIAVLKAEAGV